MRIAHMKFSPETTPVCTRCLITEMYGPMSLREVTVLEWAPSGKRVKLHYATQPPGAASWLDEHAISSTKVVEILPPAQVLAGYLPPKGSSADITDPAVSST